MTGLVNAGSDLAQFQLEMASLKIVQAVLVQLELVRLKIEQLGLTSSKTIRVMLAQKELIRIVILLPLISALSLIIHFLFNPTGPINSFTESSDKHINSFKVTKGTGEIYTDTLVQNIGKENDEFITSCKDCVVKSKCVTLASHYPFIDRLGYYFLKMYQSTSYVIAVDIGNKTFDGMYINSEQPTFSYRFVNGSNGKRLLLVGRCRS